MDHIRNKTFLVTGGGNGLGLAFVQRLLQDGAKIVAIIDLESRSVAVTVTELEREFGKGHVQYFPCDVSNVQQLKETFTKIWSTLNDIDVVINNAGIFNDCKWEQTIGVNVNGVIQGSLLALNYMGKHNGGKGGTIINISSITSLDVFPSMPVYCSSKHAVLAFSRCLQENFEKTGVRVLVLCPGVTTTNLINDITEKTLDLVDEKHRENFEKNYPKQSMEYVVRAMLSLLLKGPNGSVWVSEAQKPPYAVEFPPYRKRSMQIKDKRVIVTGAAGGLGMNISRELLRNGASIIAMIDVEEVAGEEAMNILNAEFGRNRAVFFHCDVANNAQFDDTFKKAVKTLGGLEILVNNVGVINEDDFGKAVDVNVTAVIRGTLLGIQQMQKDAGGKGGVIVNISSVAGLYSLSQLPVYSATEHAVVSFSRSFALPYHYEKTGVRIMVLCPELSQMSNDAKDLEDSPSRDEVIQKYIRRVDSVAHGLIYVIRCAQNGSIWISEDGKPVYEIQLFDTLPQKKSARLINTIGEDRSNFSTLRHVHSVLCLSNSLQTDISCVSFLSRSPSDKKMEDESNKGRRSSASEKAKEIEAINGLVSGKNVLITGGAAGLGNAFMNHFLKHGANRITILDIDEETGKRVELSVEKSYGEKKVHFIHVDVSNYELMAAAFDEATSLMNDIDIIVNNAGTLDERRWEREIAVNIGGMMCTALLAVKYLSRDQLGHGGTLVNISQHVDIRSTAQIPIYTATKHAIIGLSQSLADSYQYEKTGIRVITLCPGLTETALTVNSPNRLLSRVMKADFVKNLEQLSIQTPYVVAQGLMSILRIAESGTIWVIENGRTPYEVYVPNPRSLRRTYKNNFTLVETKVTTRGRPIREVCDNTRTGLMSCA
ncbi:uncharacterized protein LOC122535699 [Frieseomelitta varia]|uniref:uncharacterized protein LOC122535699 n=1 Tax=Frieseomelitta varia TaxID=561572 RepID=UPI001CB6817A|nr:uncharacterized protein LOC122535699 [Frieseomelitta varia]